MSNNDQEDPLLPSSATSIPHSLMKENLYNVGPNEEDQVMADNFVEDQEGDDDMEQDEQENHGEDENDDVVAPNDARLNAPTETAFSRLVSSSSSWMQDFASEGKSMDGEGRIRNSDSQQDDEKAKSSAKNKPRRAFGKQNRENLFIERKKFSTKSDNMGLASCSSPTKTSSRISNSDGSLSPFEEDDSSSETEFVMEDKENVQDEEHSHSSSFTHSSEGPSNQEKYEESQRISRVSIDDSQPHETASDDNTFAESSNASDHEDEKSVNSTDSIHEITSSSAPDGNEETLETSSNHGSSTSKQPEDHEDEKSVNSSDSIHEKISSSAPCGNEETLEISSNLGSSTSNQPEDHEDEKSVNSTDSIHEGKTSSSAPGGDEETLETPSTQGSSTSNQPEVLDNNATEKKLDDESDHKTTPPSIDQSALRTSIDHLFLQVTDMKQVKVRDVMESIEVEYDCVLTKPLRKVVRERLVALIQQKVQPLQESDEENNDDSNDESSENEEGGDEEDEEHVDSESNGEDSEEEANRPRTRRRGKRSDKGKKGRKTSKVKGSSSSSETRAKRQQMKKKLKAVRKQAELLRKSRLDELRVRNEELEAMKQDESRAERIAAKLDTNTDEQVRHRLEQRVQLVEQLAQKRMAVMQPHVVLEDDNAKKGGGNDDDDDGSSSDESIEVVGSNRNKKGQLLFDGQKRNHALGLLTLVDRGVSLVPPKTSAAGRLSSQTKTTANGKMQLKSPTPMVAVGRAALRSRLMAQRRHLGNWWLARELNYNSVQEHVQDCKTMEEQKRQTCFQVEQVRMQQCQKQLQRRLERQGNGPEDSNDDDEEEELEIEEPNDDDIKNSRNGEEEEETNSEPNDSTPNDLEENEEMVVAKQLDQVQEIETDPPNDLPDDQGDISVRMEDAEDEQCHNDKEEQGSFVDTAAQSERNRMDQNLGDDDSDNAQDCELDKQDALPHPAGISGNEEAYVYADRNPIADAQSPEKVTLPTADSVEDTGNVLASSQTDTPKADVAQEETLGDQDKQQEKTSRANRPRNQAWKAMLQQDAKRAKIEKRRKAIGGGLVEEEADEEEEDQIVGLEDFGFTVRKKNADNDEDDADGDGIRKDDLEGVVDDLSDGEGDEEAGEAARKKIQAKEEKERHKEVIRRLREGYDGRRGGIGSGAGVRGVHRFDQLVAADNREDARRLGLLNDDELDSDDDEGEGKTKENESNGNNEEDEDEAALVDKMLRDRFMHRSSVELEENFSDDEEEEEGNNVNGVDAAAAKSQQEQEEEENERVAKRFAKRARMQRLIEQYGEEEEFSQARLMDEDQSLKWELQNMKVRRKSLFRLWKHQQK